MSIPTLAVFKDGEMVKREVGAKSKAEILGCWGRIRNGKKEEKSGKARNEMLSCSFFCRESRG